ncbi:lipopolysaccharide/colanic/teichoic acid biosynthesis glycosyltransferase [Stakelama sediminis]|uniref:Lipopolysaccharide/colanic/teichoic acid biosynthesis glycosyltransferase n=1 Tax=Stakelama sediminis TaxID=463200 RepID=A0A840Z371_9SPHN|nr:lipopolysaccharide/colanic/teichoic acid biosynthesis glycosyltransferase [Stakelama sediminis]
MATAGKLAKATFQENEQIGQDLYPVAPLPAANSPAQPGSAPNNSVFRGRAILILLLVDIFAIATPFLVISALRTVNGPTAPGLYATALVLLYLVVGGNQHAYTSNAMRSPYVAVRKGVRSLLLATAAATLALFYTKTSGSFSRLTIGLGSVSALILLSMARFAVISWLDRLIGGHPFQTLVIVDGNLPVPKGNHDYVFMADPLLNPDLNDPKMYQRMAKALGAADRVLVVCEPRRRMAWTRALQGTNVQGEIYMPELHEYAPSGMGRDRRTPSIIVATGPLNLFDRATKRLFDLAVASIALLLLSPLLITVAIWIKLDSRGPVFFRQERIGRSNHLFRVYKFRSMYADLCDAKGSRSTSRSDDRITRVGNILRKTSIDELPQLLNVLRGEMSIVGPRPHAVASRAADKLFWEVDRRYWDRHAAKPGVTGLAQVRGFRGATLVERDLQDRLNSDLEYLQGWTIWRDFKIVFQTVGVVFHRNAF